MFGLIFNYQRLDVFMLGNKTLKIDVITGAFLVSPTCDYRNLHGVFKELIIYLPLLSTTRRQATASTKTTENAAQNEIEIFDDLAILTASTKLCRYL